jgi:tellurium resistance protein TerD
MATFKIEKGNKFGIDKGIQRVVVGLGWDTSKLSKPIDVDAHAFGCVNVNGAPSFYNDGSHAVTYANKDLKKGVNKSFGTSDDSIIHTGDNKTGAGDGDDEQIKISLDKVPADINDIMLFVTIHEAEVRGQHFGMVDGAYVCVIDEDTKAELCRYNLRNEFDGAITIQVGSLAKENDNWSFKAVGAGTASDALEDVLGKLS